MAILLSHLESKHGCHGTMRCMTSFWTGPDFVQPLSSWIQTGPDFVQLDTDRSWWHPFCWKTVIVFFSETYSRIAFKFGLWFHHYGPYLVKRYVMDKFKMAAVAAILLKNCYGLYSLLLPKLQADCFQMWFVVSLLWALHSLAKMFG